MEGERRSFAILGTLVDSLPDWSLRVQPDGLLIVGDGGTIVWRGVASQDNIREAIERLLAYNRNGRAILISILCQGIPSRTELRDCGRMSF